MDEQKNSGVYYYSLIILSKKGKNGFTTKNKIFDLQLQMNVYF